MNVLDVADQERILGLLRLGWSIRRIARETGTRHETIRRYGIAAGLLKSKAAKPHTAQEVFPGSGSPQEARPPTRSGAEAFRKYIEDELAKGRNAKAIYQDLVAHHGYTASYESVKRFARKLRKREPNVKCRFETAPGVEAQVDYGEGAPARDPRTGKYRKPRLFVMTLGKQPPRVSQSRVEFVDGNMVPVTRRSVHVLRRHDANDSPGQPQRGRSQT